MGDSANQAIRIAVSIFVTIIIVTGVLMVINNVKEVYSKVYKTNTGLQSEFYEFDEYENTEKTGIDLLNTVKKYLDDPIVYVTLNQNDVKYNLSTSDYYRNYKTLRYEGSSEDYQKELVNMGEKKYNVSHEEIGNVTYIYFKEI